MAFALLLTAGCEAATHGDFSHPDAHKNGDAATDDADIDAPDAAGACAASGGERTVFLDFDGVTLNAGATSDSTMHVASWMGNNTATIGAYQNGSTTAKADVTAKVTSILAQFPNVSVVTERPPAGSHYVEIVFGGNPNQIGTQFNGAVQALDCGDVNKNDLGIVFDNIGGQQAANFAVGAIGYGLGLTGTRNSNNCMCSWNVPCTPNNGAPCTLSATAAINGADPHCAGEGATQDQVTPFQTNFCH